MAIINWLSRLGFRRGVQGSQPWLIVAIIAGTIRVLRRVNNSKCETIWRQALQPGDRFEVTVRPSKKR